MTVTPPRYTKKDLLVSLTGDLCPACGADKQPTRSLCLRCFNKLPRHLKQHLYRRIGNGYEEAIAAALRHLEVTEPQWRRSKP